MNVENLKTCRYCAEKINATAKVCPRCRQWLTIFSLRNTTVLIWAISLGAALLIITVDVHFHKLFKRGVDFSPYRNQISVTESHMVFGTNEFDHRPMVSVIAIVTNQTDLAWDGISFDVRFFDKAGTLIDVGRGAYFETLYPQSDAAVKITEANLHPFADYDSYKIYIGNAHDVRSIWK